MYTHATPGFYPYLMLDYPDTESFLETIDVLIQHGAVGLELGIPFSDPTADGPILTAINHEMCTRHQPLDYYIGLIKHVKTAYPKIYICVMTYTNPVYQYGYATFMDALVDAGCDCFLIPDMPLGEYHHLPALPAGLSNAMIVSNTLDDETIIDIANHTSGFLYVMSSVTTTGSDTSFYDSLQTFVTRLKVIVPDQRLIVGFGIKTRADKVYIQTLDIDGYIIGSSIAQVLQDKGVAGISIYMDELDVSQKKLM